MEIEFLGGQPEPYTDMPRDLTETEINHLRATTRLAAIKQHRTWTRSTLGAAVRVVDEILFSAETTTAREAVAKARVEGAAEVLLAALEGMLAAFNVVVPALSSQGDAVLAAMAAVAMARGS